MITAAAAITRITNGRITVLSPVFTALEVWFWPLLPVVVPAVCPPEVPLELFSVPFAEVPSVLFVPWDVPAEVPVPEVPLPEVPFVMELPVPFSALPVVVPEVPFVVPELLSVPKLSEFPVPFPLVPLEVPVPFPAVPAVPLVPVPVTDGDGVGVPLIAWVGVGVGVPLSP